MNKKLKQAPYVVKRYEPKLGKYFFYNAKNKTYWDTDSSMGSIIVSLNGSLTTEEVIDILLSNNPELPIDEFRRFLCDKFDFLVQEEFLCAEN